MTSDEGNTKSHSTQCWLSELLGCSVARQIYSVQHISQRLGITSKGFPKTSARVFLFKVMFITYYIGLDRNLGSRSHLRPMESEPALEQEPR